MSTSRSPPPIPRLRVPACTSVNAHLDRIESMFVWTRGHEQDRRDSKWRATCQREELQRVGGGLVMQGGQVGAAVHRQLQYVASDQ